MLINGVDLSALGIELYDRILTSNDVETTQEWLEGDIQPTFIRQQDKFKSMTLKFLVLEHSEDAAFRTMSKLTAMLKRATILFDDISLLFDVSMDGEARQERLKNGAFVLTFNLLSDYGKGQTEIYTTDETATNYFNLRILYYQDGNNLIRSETHPLRSSDFQEQNTWESLGINLNKYKPNYYNNGKVTNMGNLSLTYETLYELQTIIINYAPTLYNKTITYFIKENGTYIETTETTINFTKNQIDTARNIGDLINLNLGRPNGYRASTNFDGELTFDNFINWNLQVFYDQIENEKTKNVTIIYSKQMFDNTYEVIDSQVLNVKESDFIINTTLLDIINLNAFKPIKYYTSGSIVNEDINAIVAFDDVKLSYEVRYDLIENDLYVEYYFGSYPSWNRATTTTYKIKYNISYEDTTDLITRLGINIDALWDSTYEHGVVYRAETYETYDDIINAGIIQIYYVPIDYTLSVKYYQEDSLLDTQIISINANMFLNDPPLGSIININALRPEGYIFDEESSYDGPVTLQALLANSPITIAYKEVDAIRTKSIVVKYKQEMRSTYSTIQTIVTTIEEAEVGGGIKLRDLFDINAYKPEWYENGIIDGYSDATLWTFDELQGEYSVLYMAGTYTTQVRYYTDDITIENWIGSAPLNYTVLDFNIDTTLTDLGVNVNAFKPNYCGDGQIMYYGPINFNALRDLASIDILYLAETEPVDPSGIEYPHRILFLQHNDMGDFEFDFANWTLNHAYINTGVTCQDMSKLTVLVDTYRVFEETSPLDTVNVDKAYLFGSITPEGEYYLNYTNDTNYTGKINPSNVNTFHFKAGRGTPELIIEESASEGFSSNTGITASSRAGYSYGTLTYTHLLESNSAPMLVPLYLFACDVNGFYRGGIAGVGIKSCKIYYDDELIRDFIPVATYDKIGEQISPSNCLYDKVTQTFFEDARQKNSFNIMDDPDYTDTNPEHNIGMYYVNYYRDGVIFNTSAIYCRESEFIDPENPWVVYDKLLIDYYQPKYYKTGVITNLAALGDISFNNVNGFIFQVNYEANQYKVTVNYYRDSVEGELLATEEVELTENMFLSVPTFGDIIDIQKYKPVSYKPNWEYNDARVTLTRILDHAPYNIVYTHVENPQMYTIKVRYYREGFGSLNHSFNPLQYYHDLGTIDYPIDETEFADGVYVEKFINFDALKPDYGSVEEMYPFYDHGEAYEWYLYDERLNAPSDLLEEYKVVYRALEVPITIRYYTDEVDEDNLIAESPWAIKLIDWPDGEQFSIVDELPNTYIDAFKPIVCRGGRIVEPEKIYTFESLVEQGYLNIIYETKDEPHDPDETDFPQKVIWFNKFYDGSNVPECLQIGNGPVGIGERPWTSLDVPVWGSRGEIGFYPRNTDIPYFDLGYTPKEIGRLRTELKGYGATGDIWLTQLNRYSMQGNEFTAFFGYVTAPNQQAVAEGVIRGDLVGKRLIEFNKSIYTAGAPCGQFSYHGHTCVSDILQANRILPLYYDGHETQSVFRGEVMEGSAKGAEYESVREMCLYYQKGYGYSLDEDLELQDTYDRYTQNRHEGFGYDQYHAWGENHSARYSQTLYQNEKGEWGYIDGFYPGKPNRLCNNDRTFWEVDERGSYRPAAVAFNPLTGIIDAYHDYLEIYDYANSNHPEYHNIDNHDRDVWEWRGKPAGPLRLWLTTNPNDGSVNYGPWKIPAYPAYYHRIDNTLTLSAQGNPYDPNFQAGYTYTEWVAVRSADKETGEMIEAGQEVSPDKVSWKRVTKEKNFAYQGFTADTYPKLQKSMIWYIKIWDRDRLVRDLIPVAAGDHIYDFVAPTNGLFDKVTEIFFSNRNEGGTYLRMYYHGRWMTDYYTLRPENIFPVHVDPDPTIWGKIVENYYDENYHFLGSRYTVIPVHYEEQNEPLHDLLHMDEFKPDDFHHSGMIDVDDELYDVNDYFDPFKDPSIDIIGRDGYDNEETAGDIQLRMIYNAGSINVYYKLLTFTKTVEYYRGNTRVGSKDLFYTVEDIRNANTLTDLGIDTTLYASNDYKPGRIVFDESILANDDIQAFIDAPSPIVIYDEYTKEERPDLLYINYYRGGANDTELIAIDSENPNYLDCDLEAKVLNPTGCIKYLNHYHTALYEDEKQDYFIAYQVDMDARYVDVHKGPARVYPMLASITDQGRYTVIEEKRGWGRLREYPRGWINLAYTKPVYGPGQNPSYEQATSKEQVTIPYETEISITKMTIDRLWGYVPEYASWIKMEEVSCTQLGRLYNALHQDVIHLDEIDWNNQPLQSLTDLGVEVNKWRLKYHDNANIDATSQLGRAQWTDRHVIEIVYPETIYVYNVYYYKDTLKTIPAKTIHHNAKYGVGRIHDLETFYTYPTAHAGDDSTTANGYYKWRSNTPAGFSPTQFYILRGLEEIDGRVYWSTYYLEGYNPTYERDITEISNPSYDPIRIPIENIDLLFEPENAWDEIIPAVNPEIARTSFSCSVTEWNPDWDTFIATSWQTDENDLPINPTLYRDTEIKLGWDFFEIDNNEFKPDNTYDNGIFIWNPHSYENNDVYFTFEELITTGSQSILYLPKLDQYKLSCFLSKLRLIETDSENQIKDFSLTPQLLNNGHWDIEVKYQNPQNQILGTLISYPYGSPNSPTEIEFLGRSSASETVSVGAWKESYHGGVRGGERVNRISDNYGVINFSNKRNTTSVWYTGNDITGYQSPKYIYDINRENHEITRALDTRQSDFYLFKDYDLTKVQYDNGDFDEDIERYHETWLFTKDNPWLVYKNGLNQYLFSGYVPPQIEKVYGSSISGGYTSYYTQPALPLTTPVTYYYIKVWKDYNLVQYWIPVPKGMPLPNGQRVPENGMYDVMSQSLSVLIPIQSPTDILPINVNHAQLEDITIPPIITPLHQPIQSNQDYNWLLTRWTGYQSQDINLIGKTKIQTKVFDVPSEDGRILTTLPAKFIMPLTKQTSDTEYGIEGSWYYNEFGWVRTEYIEILPSNSYTITPTRQVFSIKGDTPNTQVAYNAYYGPDANKSTSALQFQSENTVNVYAGTDDFIYTGYMWIPKSYTELNVEDINIQYAVSVQTLRVYSKPIADDIFLVGARLLGERITTIKQLVKDNDWQYIENEGWVYIHDAVSEVI